MKDGFGVIQYCYELEERMDILETGSRSRVTLLVLNRYHDESIASIQLRMCKIRARGRMNAVCTDSFYPDTALEHIHE